MQLLVARAASPSRSGSQWIQAHDSRPLGQPTVGQTELLQEARNHDIQTPSITETTPGQPPPTPTPLSPSPSLDKRLKTVTHPNPLRDTRMGEHQPLPQPLPQVPALVSIPGMFEFVGPGSPSTLDDRAVSPDQCFATASHPLSPTCWQWPALRTPAAITPPTNFSRTVPTHTSVRQQYGCGQHRHPRPQGHWVNSPTRWTVKEEFESGDEAGQFGEGEGGLQHDQGEYFDTTSPPADLSGS